MCCEFVFCFYHFTLKVDDILYRLINLRLFDLIASLPKCNGIFYNFVNIYIVFSVAKNEKNKQQVKKKKTNIMQKICQNVDADECM